MITMDAIVPLLTQVPLVGIFIWFVLERDKRLTETFRDRDASWREFLNSQREQNNLAISRLAEEIKSIAKIGAQTNLLIQQQRQRDASEKITR